MTTMMNGKARKSLAEQIDKLDVLLDGLGDALNDVVAQAVQDAVGRVVPQAVAVTMQAALATALQRPEVLAAIAAVAERAAASPHAAQPSLVQRLGSRCRAGAGAVWAAATQTVQSAADKVRTMTCAVAAKGRLATRSIIQQGRQASSAVRHGCQAVLARIHQRMRGVRLVGAIALGLAGHVVRAALRPILRKAAALIERVVTRLLRWGRWAVPMLLTLDLIGTLIVLGSGPVWTLMLVILTRLTVGGLVLSGSGLPFVVRSHTPTRSMI